MNTPLQQAAQAMIDRWESPDWKDTPHTAHYIAELRKALDAEITQSVEPYAVFQGLVDSGEHGAFNLDLLKMIPRGAYLYLHPPQPQATTPAVPTLKEALAQQGIKLRTEFEPKQRDHIEDSLGMVGDRAELVAMLRSACIDGTLHAKLVNKAADMLEASDERAELIERLAKQWAELDPVDPYRADVGQAVSRLEADAQQAKRVPMTEKEIRETVKNRLGVVPLSYDIDFARAIEAHHGITEPSDKGTHILRTPTDWGQP